MPRENDLNLPSKSCGNCQYFDQPDNGQAWGTCEVNTMPVRGDGGEQAEQPIVVLDMDLCTKWRPTP